MKNDLLYWFILVFMLHEFEEIIFLPGWSRKNKHLLSSRFPKPSKYILHKIGDISTSAFVLAVFEQYIIVLLITISAIYFDFYNLWTGMFMAFFVHLIMHVIQWLIVRKYVPFIVTTILCLPYCMYVFQTLLAMKGMDCKTIVCWTVIGVVAMTLNLMLVHKIAAVFDKYHRENKNMELL
jgi:hypothetical protein